MLAPDLLHITVEEGDVLFERDVIEGLAQDREGAGQVLVGSAEDGKRAELVDTKVR